MVFNRIYQLYLDLLEQFGPPEKYWPQWCKKEKSIHDREIIALGAILTQRTSWRNAQMALENLKKDHLLSFRKLAELNGPEKLINLVRVAGFYNSKPRRIWEFCKFIENYGSLGKFSKESLATVREQLLALYGIGPETADTIALYALDKPTFVIDEYTKRLVKKENLVNNFDCAYLKDFFEKNLPNDEKIYQNFHALIIFSQKEKTGWGMKII